MRDLSTFFFKRPAVPLKDPSSIHIFTVTLSGENLLYLTNIPRSTKIELVRILKESWVKGVKKVNLCICERNEVSDYSDWEILKAAKEVFMRKYEFGFVRK